MSDNFIEDIVMDKEGVIWVGTDKGFTALKVLLRIQHRITSPHEVLRPSNELSNAELKNGGFKPVFEIYNNKTGYPGKRYNRQFHVYNP